MMSDTRRNLGNFGEQVALGFLLRQGLLLETRQWRCSAGEIDLVMRDGATLVFVEVRTRRDGAAAESVNRRKQARLIALAYAYLDNHQLSETTLWRIDVVAIAVGAGGRVAQLDHICNAVEEW